MSFVGSYTLPPSKNIKETSSNNGSKQEVFLPGTSSPRLSAYPDSPKNAEYESFHRSQSSLSEESDTSLPNKASERPAAYKSNIPVVRISGFGDSSVKTANAKGSTDNSRIIVKPSSDKDNQAASPNIPVKQADTDARTDPKFFRGSSHPSVREPIVSAADSAELVTRARKIRPPFLSQPSAKTKKKSTLCFLPKRTVGSYSHTKAGYLPALVPCVERTPVTGKMRFRIKSVNGPAADSTLNNYENYDFSKGFISEYTNGCIVGQGYSVVRKDHILGWCRNGIHKGIITRSVLIEHDCLRKNCKYLVKNKASHYWEVLEKRMAQRDLAKIEKKAKREIMNAEKMLLDTLRVQFQVIADETKSGITIVSLEQKQGNVYWLFFVSDNRFADGKLYTEFFTFIREVCPEFYFVLRHIKWPDGRFVTTQEYIENIGKDTSFI